MKICVVGLGYVGLPVACILARAGHEVVGVDVDMVVVESLKKGDVHIDEPGLSQAFTEASSSGRLKITSKPTKADAFIVCVPTPFDQSLNPDTSYVRSAVCDICSFLDSTSIIVIESTIPVGLTRSVANLILSRRPDLCSSGILVAHCPERVLPGNALHEIVENDRVIGGINSESSAAAAAIYRTFSKGTIVETNAETAELSKLAENTYRDVNIAFANELSEICDKIKINSSELIKIANMHPRVNIHAPGIGVGGHCIPVDPWFIVSSFPSQSRLIRTARQVNVSKEDWVVSKIIDECASGSIKSVVLLGLTYKPDVDDFRESPAVRILGQLYVHTPRLELSVIDPYIDKFHGNKLDDVVYEKNPFAVSASLVVVLVKHSIFGAFLEQLRAAANECLVLDFAV